MAEYLLLSDVQIDPTGCAKAWVYIGMAMKLAHSVSSIYLSSLGGRLSLIADRSSYVLSDGTIGFLY